MRLDIVIPAHNEEHRIGPTLAAYRAGCVDPGCRFLVGLDNCTDATGEIVDSHAQQDVRVEKFEYPKLGKGGVIMETFRHYHADLVAFVDADCATLPNEMLRLAQTAAQFDGAIASRRHPAALLPARRSLPRRLTSAGFAYGVKRIFGLPYTDTQCGAKVLRRDVVERVLPLLSSRDLLFDVDLLLTLRALGYRVVHLVRDSRAVAYSWRRKKYNPGSGTDMNRYSLMKTGIEWSAINALTAGLARRSSAYVLVRYEDLVADPGSELRRILDVIDEEATVPDGGLVRFGDDHTVTGNPIRFKRGETQLRLDDEWRSAMKLSDKFAMTSLTLPGLTRYGFAPSWAV